MKYKIIDNDIFLEKDPQESVAREPIVFTAEDGIIPLKMYNINHPDGLITNMIFDHEIRPVYMTLPNKKISLIIYDGDNRIEYVDNRIQYR